MSKYVLMHGTFVEVSDEELMHWKYIKREKKNGRWVYYYDEKAANKSLENAKIMADLSKQNAAEKLRDKYVYDNKFMTDVERENRYQRAVTKAKKAVKKYETIKVGKMIDKATSNVIVKVANFFSGLFSKRKPQKHSITYLK